MVVKSQKIQARKNAELPITYSHLGVDRSGKLVERTSKLDKRIVEGYGVIWGNINGHGERFVKGAFSKAISDLGPEAKSRYKLKLCDRHGKSVGLFAELKEDDIGLYFCTVPLDDVQWATDLITQLKSGTLNNFSIGFRHVWDKVEWDEENDCLVVLEARLYEISVVDIPSDMETYALRSIGEEEFLSEDIEDFILSIPKDKQVEARNIFTRCMALTIDKEQQEQQRNALKDKKPPTKAGLDYNYLISKI